jgi:hypothetical protein
MSVLLTVAGFSLVLLVGREMFHHLLHPEGRAASGELLMRGIHALCRRVEPLLPGSLNLAGPLGVLTVIASWASVTALGWALVYWPHLPEGFRAEPGALLEGGQFWTAIYLSLVMLGTLGLGDITPTAPWLQVTAPLEALMGFALLTASLGWVLTLHAALGRRRALAHQVHLLTHRGPQALLALLEDPRAGPGVVWSLVAEVATVRKDLVHLPTTRFFHSEDPLGSFAQALPRLKELAKLAQHSPQAPQRLGALLEEAVDSLQAVLDAYSSGPASAIGRRRFGLHLRRGPRAADRGLHRPARQ